VLLGQGVGHAGGLLRALLGQLPAAALLGQRAERGRGRETVLAALAARGRRGQLDAVALAEVERPRGRLVGDQLVADGERPATLLAVEAGQRLEIRNLSLERLQAQFTIAADAVNKLLAEREKVRSCLWGKVGMLLGMLPRLEDDLR